MRGLVALCALCVLVGILIGVEGFELVGSAGLDAVRAHFHPHFASLDALRVAAEEDRHSLDLIFGTIIGLGGVTLTCTVGYLAVPAERFSEAAQRLADQAFCLIYQNVDDRNHHLERARSALAKDEKSRTSLITFYSLVNIQVVAPWTYRPHAKQKKAFGDEARNFWRGTRIAFFVRGADIWFAASLAGTTAAAVIFAAAFLTRIVSLDNFAPGPWPVITDLAQFAALVTAVALILVMAVAVMRALTALSVRHAVEVARSEEGARLADEAARFMAP